MLLPGVALKLLPVIVTPVPGIADFGEKVTMLGGGGVIVTVLVTYTGPHPKVLVLP